MGRRERASPCRLLKGIIQRPAEDGSEMDPRAIMQAKEIKAARLKDTSAMKSEVVLCEGDWQSQRTDCRAAEPQSLKKKIRHKRRRANG